MRGAEDHYVYLEVGLSLSRYSDTTQSDVNCG